LVSDPADVAIKIEDTVKAVLSDNSSSFNSINIIPSVLATTTTASPIVVLQEAGSEYLGCNVTFQQQMLGFLYVLFLVTVVVILSFKAKGVRENYREAMYIGLTMGFTVCIFLVWILAGFIAPPEYQVTFIDLSRLV
jgi:hypothetical protein